MKREFFLFALVIGLMSVVSCGRMSDPYPPEDSTYPRFYTVKIDEAGEENN